MTKTNIQTESFEESLFQSVERVVFRDKEPTEAELNRWISENREEIQTEIESRLPEIVRYLHKRPEVVKKPVLSFDGGRLELWVYDAYQHCPLVDHRSFQFGGLDGTAGLVYVERSHGLNATEYPINNQSTWEWIQKWMQIGMDAEGVLKKQPEQAQ